MKTQTILQQGTAKIKADLFLYNRLLPKLNELLVEAQKLTPISKYPDFVAFLEAPETYMRRILSADPVKIGNVKFSKQAIMEMVELPDMAAVNRCVASIQADLKNVSLNNFALHDGELKITQKFIDYVTQQHTVYANSPEEAAAYRELQKAADIFTNLRNNHIRGVRKNYPGTILEVALDWNPQENKFTPNLQLLRGVV